MSAPDSPRLPPLEMARALMGSRVLLTAVELHLFDQVAQGADSTEALIEAMGTDPRATERLLNALAGIGLLRKDAEGRFHNTDEATRLLTTDAPNSQLGALRHYAYLWDSWSGLTEVVRTGKPVRRQLSPDEDADRTDAFIAAMACFARERAPLVAAAVELSSAKRLLDVGCGPAFYAIEFCRRNLALRATAFDLPPVIPLAEKHIAEAGLSDRIETQIGNYNVHELGEGYDLVLLSSILHSNGKPENQALLAKAFRALIPGGRVLIQEFIPDESRTRPPAAARFGINMLVNTEAGDVFAEAEMTAWLNEAGFIEPRRLDAVDGADLLLATKPGG